MKLGKTLEITMQSLANVGCAEYAGKHRHAVRANIETFLHLFRVHATQRVYRLVARGIDAFSEGGQALRGHARTVRCLEHRTEKEIVHVSCEFGDFFQFVCRVAEQCGRR